MVSVVERGSGQPVSDAHVTANVAELGFAGSDSPMPLTAFGNSPVYGTYIPVLPGRAYRVLVNIRGQRLARTLEAQFQYRHHH